MFGKKSKSPKSPPAQPKSATATQQPPPPNSSSPSQSSSSSTSSSSERPQLTFHCQQAHGSPTGIISGFSNVKELYEKIAECYDMSPKDVS